MERERDLFTCSDSGIRTCTRTEQAVSCRSLARASSYIIKITLLLLPLADINILTFSEESIVCLILTAMNPNS